MAGVSRTTDPLTMISIRLHDRRSGPQNPRSAEGEGFEPPSTDGYALAVFKTATIGLSVSPPRCDPILPPTGRVLSNRLTPTLAHELDALSTARFTQQTCTDYMRLYC